MKLLITSGPTREPIDGVRYITNLSSGKTGRELAEFFIAQGHEVVFLYGKGSEKPSLSGMRPPASFETFQDLNSLLQKTLREEPFDVVIHLAAVSDYSVQSIQSGTEFYSGGVKSKIDSSQELTIQFYRNFKILDRIKSYCSGFSPRVIGFKLTNSADKDVWKAAVDKVYASTNAVDLVVHNDVSDLKETHHTFRVVRQNRLTIECQSTLELGQTLDKLFSGRSL